MHPRAHRNRYSRRRGMEGKFAPETHEVGAGLSEGRVVGDHAYYWIPRLTWSFSTVPLGRFVLRCRPRFLIFRSSSPLSSFVPDFLFCRKLFTVPSSSPSALYILHFATVAIGPGFAYMIVAQWVRGTNFVFFALAMPSLSLSLLDTIYSFSVLCT